ncbi:MAG TPA: DUF433 domain-containing protein [Longimicrobium sp.]|nr:DUF433 domain-containing protein [Longimicrobium sp.]
MTPISVDAWDATMISVTPIEAAFVTRLSRKTVEQAIDRHEVSSMGLGGGVRVLGYADLVYLRGRGELGRWLSAEGKREVYGTLRSAVRSGQEHPTITIGPMSIDLSAIVGAVRERLEMIRQAEAMVSVDPDVRAGEPVVRGTRVPVHMLADLVRQGASREELAEDYPAVSEQALEAALLYARLHPRRGRRPRAPWHAETETPRPARGRKPRAA